ncbi:DUF1207 domain-containing protein [Rhodopirellula sallentina]|nr:DUF1207 domain-containing protein [Rhodopirellula sallentina]
MSMMRRGALIDLRCIILCSCVFTVVAVCNAPQTVADDASVASDSEGAIENGFALGEAPAFVSLPLLDTTQNDATQNDTETPVGSAALPTLPSSYLPADAVEQTLIRTIASVQPVVGERDWHVLPDGLMYHSYLAGPQEPRMSAILFGDDDGGYFWDATLGGRVGFLRYGTPGADDPQGFQWDFEGAVITRLDLLNSEDVESMDFRFGTLLTWADGPWATKFGYFHLSSHVGDEYLIRNPTFERINYVAESLIYGVSYTPSDATRVYGEVVAAVKKSGGAKRMQFQTGAEWTPPVKHERAVAPFAAANFVFHESTDYHASTTLQAGWSYQGSKSDRRLRLGMQYGNGPTSQFSFYERYDNYLGFGIWFDY